MSDTKLKRETIDGRQVDIYVTDGGTFKALMDGGSEETYSAASLPSLMKQVREIIKGQTKEIPAAQVGWSSGDRWSSRGKKSLQVELLIISGIHAGNGNVLYRHEGQPRKNTQQGYRYHSVKFLRRPTPEELEELKTLYEANDELERRIEAWHQARLLDVEASLKKGEPVLKTDKPDEGTFEEE